MQLLKSILYVIGFVLFAIGWRQIILALYEYHSLLYTIGALVGSRLALWIAGDIDD